MWDNSYATLSTELDSLKDKSHNYKTGKMGEWAAQLIFLSLLIPIWVNIQYKDNGRLSDIDIIALIGNELWFIEVRARASRVRDTSLLEVLSFGNLFEA
jgi:Holliday junction resolvase-like predicted endonuclease